ncbi:S-type pyocin domain-containing protein [Pseudomonas putida]|nr:S-type pyocin domain-containing protein [Pseudomonas sp. NBRC 111132]
MTSRTTMTASEIGEIYSPAPFRYDFEYLLNWAEPFTLPLVPPDSAAFFSIGADSRDAEAKAQKIINKIEATRPSAPPGLKQYLDNHYSAIDARHTDELIRLQAKRQFLLDLQEKIIYKRLPTDDFSGIHVYAPGLTPAYLFYTYIDPHINVGKEFYIAQGFLFALMRSITAAQIEILLGQSLKIIHRKITTLNSKLAPTEKITSESNTITFSITPSIQLSTTLGAIGNSHYHNRQLETTLRSGRQLLARAAGAAASRLFNVGIGALLYSSELGNSDLYHETTLSLPADSLIPDLPDQLYEKALGHGVAASTYRIYSKNDIYTLIKNQQTASLESRVPLRPLYFDKATNSYISVPSQKFPIKLTLPAHIPGDASTTKPSTQIPSYPYRGVTLNPLYIEASPLPALEPEDFKDCIYCFPPESGLPPLYVVFNSPYPGATTKGTYSGRAFNPDKAGGPIERLDWRDATITAEGLELVKLHTNRFDASDGNKIMIDRLEKILHGKVASTDRDKRFYTHEVRELERYRRLGIADDVNPDDDSETWNNTHTATLEDYGLSSDIELLYTPEALEADLAQSLREHQ